VKNQSIRKIIFTGPESTGKTTEAMKLAFVNQLPIVYEYARTYLEEKGMTYKMTDLYNILEKQYDLEDEAQSQSEVIVCDTDWLTILKSTTPHNPKKPIENNLCPTLRTLIYFTF